MSTIKKDYRRHFKKRVKLRYNLDLNRRQIFEIVAKIRDRDALCLRKYDSGRVLWKVNYEGSWIYVVYDPTLGIPITALPPKDFCSEAPRRKFRRAEFRRGVKLSSLKELETLSPR